MQALPPVTNFKPNHHSHPFFFVLASFCSLFIMANVLGMGRFMHLTLKIFLELLSKIDSFLIQVNFSLLNIAYIFNDNNCVFLLLFFGKVGKSVNK